MNMQLVEVDEVVISGIGGYFPKSRNIEEFKKNLLSNECLLESRWKEGENGVCNKIGLCPDIQYFDPAFFGIHRQQSTYMDPMQRLMLERTFEAICDAGLNPAEIRGKRVGVYMGSSIGENDNLFYESIVSGFGVTGHSRAMLANRISYWLNLKGPSCAYDSNWINGIEVLQMGYDAIRYGHCEAAIVGTVNLALNSEISWLYDDMGLLSSDGTTKSFDAEANGYARSDGVVSLVLQRASAAKRSYATIMGTATEFNGHRNGTLLDIDQQSMINFISNFYKNCKVKPEDVDFVECYGAALKTHDEVELNAINEVYCNNRKTPLLIGSVKPNTGHGEAAANLISLAKVLVAFETGIIPATIQYKNPNPNIPALIDGRLKVVAVNTPWEGNYAAIHGIGMSSSYAHCVLKRNVKRKGCISDDIPRLVLASTRTEEGIKEIMDTVKSQAYDPEYISLTHEFFSKSIPGHLYKGYTILDKEKEWATETEYFPGNKRQTWFIYSGMGSQWNKMGRDLLTLPIFAESVKKCHKVLEPLGIDLLDIITSDGPKVFDQILHCFVGIAAIQIGLTDTMKALGIVPDGVIGHSVGELGCAYADECLTAEQMILCAYYRGKASQDVPLIDGMMAAVGLGYHAINNQLPDTIEVACHNSSTSCTLSGPAADMEKYVKELTDKGIFARLVNVANIAYHSRYIRPAAPLLLKYLETVIPNPKPRSTKWICTSAPESLWEHPDSKVCSPQYHTNNLLRSVLFEEGCKHIPKDAVCIEIAPHGLLQAIVRKSLMSTCTNIPLTQRGTKNGIHFLFAAIGKMHLAGIDVNLAKIFPPVNYPVSRGTASLAPLVRWEHGESWRTGLEDKLNYLVNVKDVTLSIANEKFSHCVGHQMDDKIILPVSSYLSIVMTIFEASRSIQINEAIFENIRFRNVITIPKLTSVSLYGMVQRGSGEFEILSNNEIICTGRITIPHASDEIMVNTYEVDVTKDVLQLSAQDVYNEFLHRGHKYSGKFRNMKNLKLAAGGSLATAAGNLTWQEYLEIMFQQNYFRKGEKYQNISLPFIIQRINVSIPQVPMTEEDIEISFDYSTGVANMPGIQVCSVTTTILPLSPKPISYDTIDFIPYDGKNCENMEQVLNYAINLTVVNYHQANEKSILIYEIQQDQSQKSHHTSIKAVTDKYAQLSTNINIVSDPRILIVYQTEPIFILVDGELHPETVKSISTSDAFALVHTKAALAFTSELVILATFNIQSMSYALVRKVENRTAKVIRVQSDSLTVEDVLKAKQTWALELQTTVNQSKSTELVYLYSTVLPTEGVISFANEIRSNEAFSNLNFFFNFGPGLSEQVERAAYLKGLVLNVYKKKKLGTMLTCSIDFISGHQSDYLLTSGSIAEGSLDCIGINTDNETLKAKNVGLGNIDYCTVNDGSKLMGVAYFDKATCNLVPDNILQWKVPESWSAEDACTIPHAYSTAYYALIQRGKLEPGETVLIHGGCSAIGLAAISIASNMGCSVFVTVVTDFQRAFLKKQFINLLDRNVMSSENTSFELQLLEATGGVGAQVILNTTTDSLFHATVRCLAAYGRLIQLGKVDNSKNNTMGMHVFLKNTSLTGIIPEKIFVAREEVKIQIRDLVQKGIEKFVVVPLNRRVVQHQDIASILDNLVSPGNIGKMIIKLTQKLMLRQLNIGKPNQFICDTKSTHLIYGGPAELWIDLVEWMVLRGSRKVFVVAETNANNGTASRRLDLLRNKFAADVSLLPNKIQTRDNAIELISQLYSNGPIQGVYILPNKETPRHCKHAKSVQYLECALRTVAPKALFINFLNSARGVADSRMDAGLQTYNVLWDSGIPIAHIVSALDDILSYKAGSIYVKNNQVKDIDQDSAQALHKKLLLMTPLTANELLEEFLDAPATPELIQLPSSGPRKIRELPPVILVPGFTKIETVRKFAMELLYPVFCALIPQEVISLKEAAKLYAEKIRNLYKRGPYNIIGISWGGPLAIEISRILQSYVNTQVTLLDAAPDTIQASLKCLGEGPTSEVELLNRILKINDTAFLKNLSTLPSWDSRVTAALKTFQDTEVNKGNLRLSLNNMKHWMDDIINYRVSAANPLIGECFLIRPTGSSKYDNCGLNKHFKQTPKVFVSAGDHLSILLSETTLNVINENVTIK